MRIKDRLFGNKMDQLDINELNHEKIRLERLERQIVTEIHRISEDKRKYIEKGFNSSDAEKMTLARKINLLDQRFKIKNAQADKASKRLKAIELMLCIKENSRTFEDSGALHVMSTASQTDMDEFLSKVGIRDAIESGKIDTVLRTMEEEFGVVPEIELDSDTAQLMDLWDHGDESNVDEQSQKWRGERNSQSDNQGLVAGD